MSKPDKPKARQPRGFVDRSPQDIIATERMLAVIRESFATYGFDPHETPLVEYSDALGKFLPDQDRPNAGVFSFQDDDEQWLSLRYDLTAPLARFVAENYETLPKPYRSYRSGYVFRNEKPGPGRFRQFMQFDADIVGAGSVAADAEICMLAADTMERLGIKRGDYLVRVNSRKVLDGVMDAAGIDPAVRLTVLRAIDKADKFPLVEIGKLLGEGRRDESGDFTKGAGLTATQSDRILRYLTIGQNIAELSKAHAQDIAHSSKLSASAVEELRALVAGAEIGEQGVAELEQIRALITAAGYLGRIAIDPSVVRGLEYYTGPVLEVELTFPVTNEDGQVVRFGSVAGGGRYDGLIGRFRPEPVPATGFSIGVSRLYTALKAVKSPIVAAGHERPLVIVTAMDNKTPEHMPAYQAMVASLRQATNAAGAPLLRADLYLGSSGFNAQMKYADRRGAALAVIQGSSEREAGTVVIKDLILGAELAAAGRDIKDSAEHKERQAQAQFSVPVADLVEGVKRVLARHGQG